MHRVIRLSPAILLMMACVPHHMVVADETDGALTVVPQVDLKRYMGSWYEIARLPNIYQRNLVGVIATYSLKNDGTIKVENTARSRRLDGPVRKTTASAYVVSGSRSAKWKVTFIWPFEADYWIIDLDNDYEYAVVGQPSRKNLWILHRRPEMSDELFADICARLRNQGYDPDRLIRTPQSGLGKPGRSN